MSKSQTEANKRKRTTEEIETLNALIAYLNNFENWKSIEASEMDTDIFPQKQAQDADETQSLITTTSEAPTVEQKKVTFSELETYMLEVIKSNKALSGAVVGAGTFSLVAVSTSVALAVFVSTLSASSLASDVGFFLTLTAILGVGSAIISVVQAVELYSKKHKEKAENTKSTQSQLLKFFDAHPKQKDKKEDSVLESIDKYAAISAS